MENGHTEAPLVTPKRNQKAKFKNYDALNEEKEAFGVVVGGREIEFPKVMPAKVILDIERAKARGDFETENAQVNFGFQIIERVIGKQNWDFIMEHVDVHQAREIVDDMMRYHGFGGSKEDEDEAPLESVAKELLEESPSSESSSISLSSTETSSVSGPLPGSGTTQESLDGGSLLPESQPFPKEASS